MTITFVNEFEIDSKTQSEISELLSVCFPTIDYKGLPYFKQRPHYRLLLKENDQLVGHLGIDYRIMSLNGEPINVLGVVCLAVHPNHQHQGLGTKLMQEFDKMAITHSQNIDFSFLVTDEPDFYSKLGYQTASVTTTWLKIDQGKNYGIGQEKIEDCHFMYKQIGSKEWKDGNLDLLGYMF